MEYTDIVKDARNGRYDENGNILAEVQFVGRDDWLLRMVTKYESSEEGKLLFAAFEDGKYGPVVPFAVTPEMLTAAKQAKHAEIKAWRNTQENANYVFQFNNHNWDYGKATQERLTLSVQMAKANKLPAGFIWTDADNNDVPVSAGELLNLSDAIDKVMFKKGLEIHLRQRQMKEEVDKLTDYREIQNYTVGWLAGS
ncbi:DUF4376 domain-containing protein [Salmonella enterica subsp. enterica serovar Muenchen]|uniref:DUF4376 domain-containing protein n=1 Tax=Salmonella enterica TaxID=28901 RepID=UPI001F1180AE|nr:DUF4376 domain-containing protein [Salmonella enterica]MCH5442679.1 DUF4376 domain-containing protein [Salmonella enterica subsp. enterica serovar Muenchen]